MPASVDEFRPLCADVEDRDRDFWRPLDMLLHQDCHVFVSASELGPRVAPDVWSGDREDGMAEGESVLLRAGRTAAGGWNPKTAGSCPSPMPTRKFTVRRPATTPAARASRVPREEFTARGRSATRVATARAPARRTTSAEHGPACGSDGVYARVPCENGVVHGELMVSRPEGTWGR